MRGCPGCLHVVFSTFAPGRGRPLVHVVSHHSMAWGICKCGSICSCVGHSGDSKQRRSWELQYPPVDTNKRDGTSDDQGKPMDFSNYSSLLEGIPVKLAMTGIIFRLHPSQHFPVHQLIGKHNSTSFSRNQSRHFSYDSV